MGYPKTVFSIFAVLLVSMATCDMDTGFKTGLNSFSVNLFNQLWKSNNQKNIIFSPYSIQACISMVRLGTDGETATEMDRTLKFIYSTPNILAANYHSLLANYENSNILHMANKIYVNQQYQLQDTFKQLISENFYASAESIDFAKSKEAAEAINSWVALKTNQLIKNAVSPDMMSSDTASFLLSAIHFDGKWATEFPVQNTKTEKFYIDEDKTVDVQMMKVNAQLHHTRIPDIDADVAIMPYQDSDLSMLILLPRSRTGLSAMLEKLKTIELGEVLTERLAGERHVSLALPKFKIDMEFDLIGELKELGMKKVFEGGDFSKMLKPVNDLQISKFIHKAFIEVNEAGTKAAAVTITKHQTRRLPTVHRFHVDHPFYFMIVNKDYVPFFQGAVLDF